MKEVVRKLLNRYGEDTEKLKVLEEISELSNELWRDINHGKPDRRHILEERIDVEIMLNLIDEIYSFSDITKHTMMSEKLNKINEKYLKEE